MNEPFLWKKRKAWYVWVTGDDGKQRRVKLAKTKTEAFERWKAGLQAGQAEAAEEPTFSSVAAKWLNRQYDRRDRGGVSVEWVERVARTVTAFKAANPGIRVRDITPSIATEWLPKGCSLEYERTEVGTLKQILRWAESDGRLIRQSPLRDMKLERGEGRDVVLTHSEHLQLVDACRHEGFKSLLHFAWHTGARPGELRLMKWEHVSDDLRTASMKQHKNSRKKRGPRVLYFNNELQAWLKANHKLEGFVFLNSRGRAWTKDAVVQRMDDLETATRIRVTAYAYRHSFITRAVLQKVDPATVAELTGTSIEMISRYYCHANQAKEHLALANSSITDVSFVQR